VASTRDQGTRESASPSAQTEGQTAPAQPESAGFKYRRYDDSPGSTHNLVVELVPERSSVLEFGSATGYMSDVLTRRRGCRVTGIELDPEAGEEAKAFSERVIVGDAETLDLEEHLGNERFDVVLFADVLEHLRDPAAMLSRVRPFVAEGGAVVASIPNVAHVSVRLALLSGEFRYRDLGLLDDTHLRFFTRSSIVDLFESAGYVVSTWRRRRIELDEAEIEPPADVPNGLSSWLGSDPELTTYQFVVRAVPTDAASQLAGLRASLGEAEAKLSELPMLEETLEELEATREELEQVRQAHEAQARHLITERLSFADQIGELDGVIERLREEVDWRKGVMDAQEQQLTTLQQSRSLRYTEPFRRIAAALRR
jgi:O-antigen biosynthesis protein